MWQELLMFKRLEIISEDPWRKQPLNCTKCERSFSTSDEVSWRKSNWREAIQLPKLWQEFFRIKRLEVPLERVGSFLFSRFLAVQVIGLSEILSFWEILGLSFRKILESDKFVKISSKTSISWEFWTSEPKLPEFPISWVCALKSLSLSFWDLEI